MQGPWVGSGSPSPLGQSHHSQVLLAVLREKQVLLHLLLLTAEMYLYSNGTTCGGPATDAKFKKPHSCMATAETLTLPMSPPPRGSMWGLSPRSCCLQQSSTLQHFGRCAMKDDTFWSHFPGFKHSILLVTSRRLQSGRDC